MLCHCIVPYASTVDRRRQHYRQGGMQLMLMGCLPAPTRHTTAPYVRLTLLCRRKSRSGLPQLSTALYHTKDQFMCPLRIGYNCISSSKTSPRPCSASQNQGRELRYLDRRNQMHPYKALKGTHTNTPARTACTPAHCASCRHSAGCSRTKDCAKPCSMRGSSSVT